MTRKSSRCAIVFLIAMPCQPIPATRTSAGATITITRRHGNILTGEERTLRRMTAASSTVTIAAPPPPPPPPPESGIRRCRKRYTPHKPSSSLFPSTAAAAAHA